MRLCSRAKGQSGASWLEDGGEDSPGVLLALTPEGTRLNHEAYSITDVAPGTYFPWRYTNGNTCTARDKEYNRGAFTSIFNRVHRAPLCPFALGHKLVGTGEDIRGVKLVFR